MVAGCSWSLIGSGFLLACGLAAAAPADGKPPWWENSIGKDDIVLPGFEPLRRQGDQVALFGRTYHWRGSYLPSRIDSRAQRLVNGMRIELTRGKTTIALVPDITRWRESGPTRQVYEAVGRWNGLRFKVHTVLEYDGVADITLFIDPEVAETVDSINVVTDLATTPTTTFLGFPIDGIRRQKQRNDVLSLPYRGRFLAAVVAGDGDRALWWFADSQHGWIGDPVGGTEVISNGQSARIVQEIVRGPVKIVAPLEIRFGVLATPVKKVANEWRRQRPALGVPSRAENRRGGVFKLWWPAAFAYDAYPYTKYHNVDGVGLPAADKKAYPGLLRNRRQIEESRRWFDIHWIPYFSAHVLSEFDPALRQYRSSWEVQPPYVFKDGLSPYSNHFDKPTLSHNAPGYTDYLLWRIAAVANELPMEGIYLDHGPPFDSTAPRQLQSGKRTEPVRPSLDIFAERQFLKRLQTLFVTRGLGGYTFIHVSNREIIPAYTFAWALVDGEQYRSDVRDGRYQELVSLDEFRMRFGTSQYGVRSYWIPGDWWVNRDNKEWPGSEAQRQAYRRTLGLALAHDVGVWAQGSPLAERERLLGIVDEFGMERASFRGYWQDTGLFDANGGAAAISTYRTEDRLMAIVLNVSKDSTQVDLRFHPDLNACIGARMLASLSEGFSARADRYTAKIPGYDFAMLVLKLGDGCAVGAAP